MTTVPVPTANLPTEDCDPPKDIDPIDALNEVIRAAWGHCAAPSNQHQIAAGVALSTGMKAMAKVANEHAYGEWRDSMWELVAFTTDTGGHLVAFLDRWADICEQRWDMYLRPERSTLNLAHAGFPADLLDGRRRATEEEARQLAAIDAAEIRAMADAYRQAHDLARVRFSPTGFNAPDAPLSVPTALYFWYDAADVLLYVGITNDIAARQSSHAKKSTWSEFADHSRVERFPDRAAALRAEREAIERLKPLFNHVHNDTPEARQRLVAYLIERDRVDLLVPAISRG